MRRRHFATAAAVVAVTGVASYAYDTVTNTVPGESPTRNAARDNQQATKSVTTQLYGAVLGEIALNGADACSKASCPSPTPTPTPKPTPKPTPVPTPVPTPKPTPVPTPVKTPVPTPVPSGQATPTPGPGGHPSPTSSSTPSTPGSKKSTPTPTNSAGQPITPSPTGTAAHSGVQSTTSQPSTHESAKARPKVTAVAFASALVSKPVQIAAYLLLGFLSVFIIDWVGGSLQEFAQPKSMKAMKIAVGATLIAFLAAATWLITAGFIF